MFVPSQSMIDDPVRGLRDCLTSLAGQDRSGWAPSALSDLVVELAGVVERAEAELLRVVGSWDAAAGAWELEGAAGLVRDARLVRRRERTAKALAVAEITVSHVETMSRAARGRRDSFADDEDVILGF